LIGFEFRLCFEAFLEGDGDCLRLVDVCGDDLLASGVNLSHCVHARKDEKGEECYGFE
jgi:hypothetical protein